MTGYVKHYTWDPLLDFISPPSYLVPSTASWVPQSVSNNAGAPGTGICPSLAAPYGSAAGSYLTQYCAASTGGLPNYPAQTAPSSPTMGTATTGAGGAVTLTWTDPSANSSPITGYTVSRLPQLPGVHRSLRLERLRHIDHHHRTHRRELVHLYRLRGQRLGTGDPSARSNSVTIPTVPSPPTNAAGAAQPNGTVKVSWTDPTNSGSPITGYTVIPSPACPSCTGTSVSGGSATSSTIGGLTAGASYTFTVTATNAVGTSNPSSASNSVTTPTVPGAPAIGTATPGTGQATLTWTAPASNGGSAITGYVVTPYIGAAAQTQQTFVSTATTEVVTGLTNGTSYTFNVAATNGWAP